MSLESLKKRFYKIKEKIIIIYSILIILLLIWIVFINTSSTLKQIGADYINKFLIIVIILSFVIIYIYLNRIRSNLKNQKGYIQFLLNKLNPWVLLCICLILITIVITNSFLVNLYPGAKEVGRDYSWKISNQSYENEINPIHIKGITNPNTNYFVEGDILELITSTNSKTFEISYITFEEKSKKNEILNEKEEFCWGNVCSFRFTVSEEGYLYYFHLYLYEQKNHSNVIRSAFLDLYPEVLTENEERERSKNTFLLLSSLISVITVVIFTGVNHLRQIVQNKQ